MTNHITGPLTIDRTVATPKLNRQAWREEMLAQTLAKVRAMQSRIEIPKMPGPEALPPKGSLLDVFA